MPPGDLTDVSAVLQGRLSAHNSGVSVNFNTRPSAKGSQTFATQPTFDGPPSPEATDGADAGTKVLANMKAIRRVGSLRLVYHIT